MMTNSSAMPVKRNSALRATIFGGFVIVAVTLPASFLYQSGAFSGISEYFQKAFAGKSEQSTEKKTTPLASLKSKLSKVADHGAAQVGAFDLAAGSLSKEISKSPHDPALQNQLGLVYFALGDLSSAEICFKTAVNLCKGSLAGYEAEFKRLGKSGQSSGFAAQKIVLESCKLSSELSAAHSNLARVYDKQGKREAVVRQLGELNKDGLLLSGLASAGGTSKGKQKENALSGLLAQRLARAEALFKTNRLQPALEEYRQLAEAAPKQAFVFDRIGLISVMIGDLNSAVDAWEKAAAIDKDSAGIAGNLGLAYHQLGLDKESEKWYRRALALDAKAEESALNLAALLSGRGQMAESISLLQRAANDNPKSARIANNLGTYLLLSGKNDDALSAFHRALRLDQHMASAHYGMGLGLMKTHKYVPAIKELRLAQSLNPSLHEAQIKIEEAMKLSSSSR